MISDEEISIDTFSIVRDKTQKQLVTLIDKDVEQKDIKPFVLVKNLFKACMNKTLIEIQGIQTFSEMHKSLGGWPCVNGDKWDRTSTWNWIETTRFMRKFGFSHNYLFSVTVDIDMKNSSGSVLTVSMKYEIILCEINK